MKDKVNEIDAVLEAYSENLVIDPKSEDIGRVKMPYAKDLAIKESQNREVLTPAEAEAETDAQIINDMAKIAEEKLQNG